MNTPIAAIDVGSGMTKFVIAILKRGYDKKPVIQVIQQIEKPIPYGVDWKSSTDGYLSKDIQQQGLELFHCISDILNEWKDKNKSEYSKIDVIGVGTEVFRKAENGEEFLKRIASETNLKIELISQEREAIIGFRTGEAALMTVDSEVLKNEFDYDDGNGLAVYDSGGGSTQITWINRVDNESKGCVYEERLLKVLKPYGLAPALHELLILQHKRKHDNPNPVTFEIAMNLVDSLISQYIDPKDIEQFSKENCKPLFLSIGGINSHVRLAADVIKDLETEERLVEPTKDAETIPASKWIDAPKTFSFTEESVTKALKRICGRKDDELQMFRYYENAEPVNYMVPKLCILLAALKGYQISKLHWIMSCGNCFGLILDRADELDSKPM